MIERVREGGRSGVDGWWVVVGVPLFCSLPSLTGSV